MKRKLMTLVAVAATLAFTGCSTLDSNQYSYQLDEERMQAEPKLTRTAAHTGHVVWVNPPQKRVKVETQQ